MKTCRLPLAVALIAATVSVGAGPHLPIYPRIMIGDQAVAYYRLNEAPGTTVAGDSTTNRLNATWQFSTAGPPMTGTVGITTNSALFAYGPGGASDYPSVTLPPSALLSPVNADGITGASFSAECWVAPQTGSPSDYLSPLAVSGAATGGASINGSGWNFYETPSNPATWQLVMRTESAVVTASSSSAIVAGQWSHLAVTFDGTNAVFYVNSVAQATNTANSQQCRRNCCGTEFQPCPCQQWKLLSGNRAIQ
jgi:Concanavalin A-like lectin/glucanases superfamily